jgi:predicted Zn-dependent peptidase
MTGVLTMGGQHRLANGVRLAVRQRPGADVTTVSVWILAGARHEAVPGTAHLFEHVVMQMVPAGRERRVVDEIEACGGDANAVTTRDHVVLYARVPTADAAAALAVLADAATGTSFDDRLVEAERRVVLEELRLAAADPTDIVHDVFFAAAFGEHPMGRPVGGDPGEVAGLGAAELTAWTRRHVRGDRLGVVVSGGICPDDVADAIAAGPLAALAGDGDHDSGTPVPSRRSPVTAPGGACEHAPALAAGRRDATLVSETAAVALGGPAFALADPRLAAAEIVVELLAGGNASVLTEEIRSRLGLAYDISGGATGYRDTGVWRVAIATAPEERDHVVELSTDLVRRTAARGWSEEEVSIARRRVAGLLRLEAESSLEEALMLGRYRFVGEVADWSLPVHLDRLAQVDASEVNRCARVMTDRLVVATAGGTG